MKRFNNKERQGIYYVGFTIEKEFKWIFREQPISDIGIDALVEYTENGQPTGKFGALQIKSGNSHLRKSKADYTYYISNIHYHYWINLDIPLILVFYLENNENQLLWCEINKKTVKKTKKRWKVHIKEDDVFNIKSLDRIASILKKQKDKFLSRPKYKLTSNTGSQLEILLYEHVTDSLDLILMHTMKVTTAFIQGVSKIEELKSDNIFLQNSNMLIQISKFRHALEVYAIRVHNEINLFASLFADLVNGIRDKYKWLGTHEMYNVEEIKKLDRDEIDSLVTEYKDSALPCIMTLYNALNKDDDRMSILLKDSIDIVKVAIKQILDELEICLEMLNSCLSCINNCNFVVDPDSLTRKNRSIKILRAKGIEVSDVIPCIANEGTFRTKSEIGNRIFALAAASSFALNIDEGHLISLMEEYQIRHLSRNEVEFLKSERKSVDKVNEFSWRSESLNTILWVAGISSEISFPTERCNNVQIFKMVFSKSRAEFESAINVIDLNLVLDQLDLCFRLWNTFYESKLLSEKRQIDFAILYQRIYTIVWLLKIQDEDWDSIYPEEFVEYWYQ